jgi:hypothetical protein
VWFGAQRKRQAVLAVGIQWAQTQLSIGFADLIGVFKYVDVFDG